MINNQKYTTDDDTAEFSMKLMSNCVDPAISADSDKQKSVICKCTST